MTAYDRVNLPDAFWFQEGPGLRKWQFTTSGIKVLNVGNIMPDGSIDLSRTDRHVSVEEFEQRYTHFGVDAGDLVMASSGISFDDDGFLRTKIAFVEEDHLPLCMNTSTIRFKAVDGVSCLEYLRHWLQSVEFRRQVSRLVTGTAQLNFGPGHLKQMTIGLPPLEEQRRIAGILDAADALRRRRREALALLDTLPGAIFAEMFLSGRPGEPERPSQPLGDLVDAVSGSTPSKENKAFWNGDVPWISPKDMKTDDLHRAILNITEEATRTGKAKLVGPDVTLIVIRGMILAHSVPICDLRVPASFNQDVKALIPRRGVSNIFISAALRASKNRLLSMVSNAAHGTKRIEMGDLMKFPIPTATEAEQEKFVKAIAGVAAQKALFEGASREGESLFASLQSRAFAGEL